MSREFRRQFAEPLGRVVCDAKGEGILAVGGAAPTNSIAGYQPGCLYVNTAGTIGTVLYVNVGTLALSSWMAIA